MSWIYHTFIYDPLYNGLVLLIDSFPWLDAGLAVIVFTIIIKFILYPLSKKAVRTQMIMRLAEKDLREIKEKYKDRHEQAVKIMAYYKEKGINPLSSIFLLFIQLPILIALYKIFTSGFVDIQADILYSFVRIPESIDLTLLDIINVTEKSYLVAAIAALSQFGYAKLATPPLPEKKENRTFGDDMARNMQLQMKYVLPIIIFFVSYHASAALAIYWATSNIFMMGQELFIRKQLKKEGVGVTKQA